MARRFVLKSRTAANQPDFSAELNPEQLGVATAPGGPMLVIAGAGSGKTRALTYRLAWLVAQGVDPGRILLVTFTNRAAREMLSRVGLLIKRETADMWGGTFHHIANRILRKYGQRIGVQPDFTILDREDARDLIASCVAETGVDTRERRFPQKAVLAAISSFMQNTLEPLDRVLVRRYPMFIKERDGIEKVLMTYISRKRAGQMLDYDDLLAGWLELLTYHQDIREQLQGSFDHILVDEYQDTNAVQAAIVDMMAAGHRNVCVVGDDSQSIYSFRGANFENIVSFRERYPDAREYRLETNYRSTPQILALANESIALNERRLHKVLHAVRGSGLKPSIVTCHDHFVQSRFVAEYILQLLDEGRKLNDIAVLYRSHWHSMEIQLELQRRNIPFEVRGGLRFFEQAHIKDMLCCLRILNNQHDELAWQRVMRMLPRVGAVLAQRLWQHVSTSENPLAAAQSDAAERLFPAPARPFYKEFTGLLSEVSRLGSPADAIEEIVKKFYGDYANTHYDGASMRLEDIKGLANFAGQYNDVGAFLADVALAGEFAGETVVTGPTEMEFVILSTVHQAKGLEWPVVLIPWMADGRFPTDMAINTQEDLEEERRVFHVAVTRAKDELYLIVPQVWSRRGGVVVMMKPSRFLMELRPDVTEPMMLEEGLSSATVGELPGKEKALPEPEPEPEQEGVQAQKKPRMKASGRKAPPEANPTE
jgi:DNA helicase II / ATP-dependent DNA helicase PcrA